MCSRNRQAGARHLTRCARAQSWTERCLPARRLGEHLAAETRAVLQTGAHPEPNKASPHCQSRQRSVACWVDRIPRETRLGDTQLRCRSRSDALVDAILGEGVKQSGRHRADNLVLLSANKQPRPWCSGLAPRCWPRSTLMMTGVTSPTTNRIDLGPTPTNSHSADPSLLDALAPSNDASRALPCDAACSDRGSWLVRSFRKPWVDLLRRGQLAGPVGVAATLTSALRIAGTAAFTALCVPDPSKLEADAMFATTSGVRYAKPPRRGCKTWSEPFGF